jgi:hypothetical protein
VGSMSNRMRRLEERAGRAIEENALPTFMCAVQVHILDDAQEGGRGWLENALPLEMAVEELPLAPYRRP